MKFWTQLEIDFLIENYPLFGLRYCINKLGRSQNAIRKKVTDYNLRLVARKLPEHFEYNFFKKIVEDSYNIYDITKKLYNLPTYGNRKTVSKFIKKYNLDTSHFVIRYGDKKVISHLSDILVQNSTYTTTSSLKKRLYNNGLKERKCELCGQGEEWFGKKLSLILDHKNGINNDNRIENLQIVCPNCNATLETHCKGAKGLIIKPVTEKVNKLRLKNLGRSEKQREMSFNQRKVKDRPSKEDLLKDVQLLGYSGTGRKYGVSDNAIRKWLK